MSTAPSVGPSGERQPQRVASLDAVLRINAIIRRPLRIADMTAEEAMHRSLAVTLVESPNRVPHAVVNAAVDWCGAASAGISYFERHDDGTSRYRWTAVAGRLAEFENYSTAGDFSPSKVCLDRDEPVLFAFPERRFTYLQSLGVAFVEMLVVPMTVGGRHQGTLWIAAHAIGRRFDLHDVETLNRLSSCAGAAYALTG